MADDVWFLVAMIRDAEHWSSGGISEADLALVFEMSSFCEWGRTFSASRFRDALRVLADMPTVTKRGERWYVATSAVVETIDEHGARLCGRRGCGKDISHLRADARFCSPGCRNRASRREGASDYPLHKSRSERREMADFSGPGTGRHGATFGAHSGAQGLS